MPGVTPNSNILDALDELIKSINDLANRPIVVNCNSGGGCCGGGSSPPLPPNLDPEEGSDPPPTFGDYTDINVTACKKAAFVYFGTLDVLTELQKYEDDIQQAFDIGVLILVAAFARLGGVAGLILAKVSGVVDLVTDILDTSVNTQVLTQIWQEKQDDLICVLYKAAKEGSGISYSSTMVEINAILADGGASTGNLGVISSILTVETLTILWYNPTYRDVTIEQQIADYVLGVDCNDCEPEDFLGWWFPTHSEAYSYSPPLNNPNWTHNGSINPGYEISYGQYIGVDGYPGPAHLLESQDGDPDLINIYGAVKSTLLLFSPIFTASSGASIIFTIEGGGNGGLGQDAQWHFWTKNSGVWVDWSVNLGNGTHTIEDIPTDATQACILYGAGSHIDPIPYVTDIQMQNITVV